MVIQILSKIIFQFSWPEAKICLRVFSRQWLCNKGDLWAYNKQTNKLDIEINYYFFIVITIFLKESLLQGRDKSHLLSTLKKNITMTNVRTQQLHELSASEGGIKNLFVNYLDIMLVEIILPWCQTSTSVFEFLKKSNTFVCFLMFTNILNLWGLSHQRR